MEYIIKKNLIQGRYEEVEKILIGMDEMTIRDVFLNIAFETESICVYSFAQYMGNKTKKLSWTELAIEIMIHPLCFIEGAYSVALFHSRELLSINRSIENLERILFFYDVPEKLVEKEEAYNIASEILKIAPHNKVATKIFYSTM